MPEYTRKEFIDRLRQSLPEKYRILSDDKLLEATYQSGFTPEFKPEPEPEPGFVEGLVQPAKEQFYRLPETAASVYNIITERMYPDDPVMQKTRKDLYETAASYSKDLVESDNRLKQFQKWAGENPFTWKSFFTNPTMFASTFSQVATSMGAIIGSGALGTAVGGPVAGTAAAASTAFALESGEAYGQAIERAKSKGYSDEDIDQIAAESGFWYGLGSAVLESIVPLSILKSFGISKRIAGKAFSKYSSNFVNNIVDDGLDTAQAGVKAWQQYALESITIGERLRSFAPILGNSLTEASTEGAQYLLQEAIIDNRTEGDITVDWIAEKLSSPEFSQSIAGGLLGGGVFTGGMQLTKDITEGSTGKAVATRLHALGNELPEEIRQKMYDSYIQRDDVSHKDKVDFATRLNELESKTLLDKIVKKTETEPITLKKEESSRVDGKRIKESAGAAKLYPTYDLYKKDIIALGLQKEMMSEKEFLADREEQINKFVESPAIPLVKKLLSEGNEPYSSNAYGPGDRGVWYTDKEGNEKFAPLDEKTPKTEPKKPSQRPPEPPGSTQKEKPTPTMPKQEKAPEKPISKEPLIDTSGIASRLANPERGRISEVEGTDTRDKALNWMILQGERAVTSETKNLPQKERATVFGLAASALVETAPDPEAMKGFLYNKDGSVNEKNLFTMTNALAADFRMSKTETVSEGLGQPKQVRKLVKFRKEEFLSKFADFERSIAAKEILEEQASEILKEQAESVVSEGLEETPFEQPKLTKRAQDYIKEHKLKPVVTEKADSFISRTDFGDAGNAILSRVGKLLSNVDVVTYEGVIGVEIPGESPARSRGSYVSGSNTIFINQKVGKNRRGQTFLHEAIHHLTADAVLNPRNGRQKVFRNRISSIRKRAIKELKPEGRIVKYLTASDAEFITGVMTEPELQKELAKVKGIGVKGSLWTDFVNALKRFLDIPLEDTLLGDSLREVMSFIEDTYVAKEKPVAKKAEPKKAIAKPIVKKEESKPVPKPKESEKTGEHKGTEVNIDGHDLNEDSDLEGFSSIGDEDVSHSINSEDDALDPDDGRDGDPDSDDVTDNELNPREFFLESMGTYLTEEQYGKLVDFIKDYGEVKAGTERETRDFFNGLQEDIVKFIRKTTGNEPVIQNRMQQLNDMKDWYHRTLSRIPIIFEGVSGRGRNKLQILVRKLNNEIIGKHIAPLSRIKMDTMFRRSDNTIVGGKKHSKTETESFIEYDQRKFGAKTKLFYLNTNDIYVEDLIVTGTGKSWSKFRKAAPHEWSLSPQVLSNMNRDFADAFLAGKDKFLKVFFAEKSGDNSKIAIAAVYKNSPLAKYGRDEFEKMLLEDASKGFLYTSEGVRETNKTIPVNLAEYTNHSGGAVGADSMWDDIGKEYGMTNSRHYYVEGNKTPRGNTALTEQQAMEADEKLVIANKTLGRKFPTSNTYVNNLLRRNWYQVKNADAVFAISELESQESMLVKGGTGWAVQMALDANKPVYLFDQSLGSWFLLDKTVSERPTELPEAPTLTKNFAGIGKREINAKGIQAIRDVYEATASIKPVVTGVNHVKQFLDSADAEAKRNPMIYAQMAIVHDKWKNIKGNNYLTRFKDVASAYKRLKIDLTEGTLVQGLGESTAMVIDPKEVRMVKVIDGKEVPIRHLKPDGSYAFDGAIFVSKRRFDRINELMGKNTYAMKTFIRNLEQEGTNVDYIGMKMAEFIGENGVRIYKDDKLIASYRDDSWYDDKGNKFDILATDDEVKDRSGKYSKNYEILRLPEHATRMKMPYDKSKKDGAHPVLSHELALDPEFMNNDAARKYIDEVFKHYRSLIGDTVDKLYSLRPDPIPQFATEEETARIRAGNIQKAKQIREIVKKEIKPGQKLMEMDIVGDIFENGEGYYMPTFMRQLIHTLNNYFIVNGLFKARQLGKGNATKLLIKPNLGHDLPKNSFLISPDNTTYYKLIKNEFKKNTNISFEGMSKSQEIKTLNAWLKENKFNVLAHRQPIQSFTKVTPKRIYGFLPENSGQVVVMNMEDVFFQYDGDHDGDTIFLERFDGDLLDAINSMANTDDFLSRNRTVDLNMFQRGSLGNSLADLDSIYKLIADRQTAANAQGMAVNVKAFSTRMAYKDFRVNFGSGDIVPYKPTEKVIMWYLPLDDKYVESIKSRLDNEGDSIVTIGDSSYLETTKENEFSILLQAAVDNDKFNLLSKIPMVDSNGKNITLHQFLLSRVFKKVDSEIANANMFTKEELQSLKVFFDIFNVSTIRAGNSSNRERLDMVGVIKESSDLASIYYNLNDMSKLQREETSDMIRVKYESVRSNNKRLLPVKYVTVNDKLTPSDVLVMAPGIRNAQLAEELGGMQQAITTKGPLEAENQMYIAAHHKTMAELSGWIREQFEADNIKDIITGYNFAQKAGTAFYETMNRVDKGASGANLPGNMDNLNVKYDYSEEIQNEVIGKYTKEFESMSDAAKKWSSIRFMAGINYKGTRISNAIKLLPLQLMHRGTVKEYGVRYMHNLYNDAGDSSLRGSEARSTDLTRVFADISSAIKESESNQALNRIETFKDKYCG